MNFLKQLWGAISGFQNYRQFAHQKFRKTLLFLFLFSISFWLVHMIVLTVKINQDVNAIRQTVDQRIPNFTLENGQLKAEGKMPQEIYRDDSTLVVLDTTGQVNPDILASYPSGVLIFGDRMIIKKDQATTDEIMFNRMQGITFSKGEALSWIPYLKWIVVLVGFFSSIYFFLRHMIVAFFVSILALLGNLFVKSKLGFGSIYSMSIYAVALPILLDALFGVIFKFGLIWWLYYGIATGYVVLALWLMKRQQVA
jgi:hypothetical protein